MNTDSRLAEILSALASYYAASEALAQNDCTDRAKFNEAWDRMEKAQDVLIHAAPSWFRDAVTSGALYGTDLPGDPSCCSPDEVADLCAMLAIASL